MPVIDKKLYEVFKKWCDGERPKNQFMMYVNTNDRKLTNATIRKLMFEIYKEDVEGEEYVAFYSAENFYRNMHDYYSHASEDRLVLGGRAYLVGRILTCVNTINMK